MTLASHALELIRVLRSVLDALDRYDTDQRRDYARSLGDRLRPLVAAFEVAVVSERSRSHAEHILSAKVELLAWVHKSYRHRLIGLIGCPPNLRAPNSWR